jgi:hypothetical protein
LIIVVVVVGAAVAVGVLGRVECGVETNVHQEYTEYCCAKAKRHEQLCSQRHHIRFLTPQNKRVSGFSSLPTTSAKPC